MPMLTDIEIRNLIKSDTRFSGKLAGDNLYLRYRNEDKVPTWRFRYSFAGKPRIMTIGNYTNLSLADARKEAKRLSARVALGFDVASEKQARKRETISELEAKNNAYTMSRLADEYFENRVMGKWRHPNIVRSRIEKDIKPAVGYLKVEDVKPRHIDDLLKKIVMRNAPTMANDVLRWLKRMFNYAIKLHIVDSNPAAPFDNSDAGGKEESRKRFLSRDEIKVLLSGMKATKGFTLDNELTIKILLALGVRKGELIGAKWSEFDLENSEWNLPAIRTKTSVGIRIPLPQIVVIWLKELKQLSFGSDWVLPARKMQNRMIPHISEGTLNVALTKLQNEHGMEHFTVHDLRRTTRTLMASLKIPSDIAERCLNHKIKGVEGIYDVHDYFEERKYALEKLAGLIEELEEADI